MGEEGGRGADGKPRRDGTTRRRLVCENIAPRDAVTTHNSYIIKIKATVKLYYASHSSVLKRMDPFFYKFTN